MCSPECIAEAKRRAESMDRRSFLRTAIGAGAAVAALSACSAGGAAHGFPGARKKVVDLTHTLSPAFPTFGGDVHFKLETLTTSEKDGYNVKKWELNEHTGTHIDAPFHFDPKNITVDKIDPAALVAPLAVIDITDKAARSADSRVTVEDILAWEKTHGRLPEGCCVAMNSGWSKRAASTKDFRNPDSKGGMHFPGFDPDTAVFLAEERSVVGVASDTLSIDYGATADFKFHTLWLSSGRWGIECIANLGEVPPSGAHVVVGAPKVAGGTGGLTRVLALL